MSEKSCEKIFLAFCFWDVLFALTCVYSRPSEAKIEDATLHKVRTNNLNESEPISSP
jgi:hypothetical protein